MKIFRSAHFIASVAFCIVNKLALQKSTGRLEAQLQEPMGPIICVTVVAK